MKIASHARQGLKHWNACSPELNFVSYAGLHQYFRCVDRSKGENYFAEGLDAPGFSLTVELDSDRPVAPEQNLRYNCASQHRNIWLVHDWVKVGAEDGLPLSIADRFIDQCASSCRLHHSTVCIREAFDARRLSALQQGESKRVGVCRGLHMHHTFATPESRIRTSSPRLNPVAVQIENGVVAPRRFA